MSNEESQAEELEVLQSIYEGDTNYKSLDNSTFQYKFGVEHDKSTVLIEIKWSPDYPEDVPNFNLDAFYNNHLSSSAKNVLLAALQDEANANIGSQQTYTIIEWARENYEAIITPYLADDVAARIEPIKLDDDKSDDSKKVSKKEQLTKNQKRKEWDRLDAKGEKPRGYDWIDVIKHLSQTGFPKTDEAFPAVHHQLPENYLNSTNLPN